MAFQASVDLVPLYPLYAVLFADSGLSAGEIALLLGIWVVAGLVLEVPSGALADTVSRRKLLMIGTTARAAGFALWVVWPTLPGFAIGFVLWAVEDSLNSGTSEALLYDELTALGAAENYQRWSARTHTASLAAQFAATLSAAPLFAIGGYWLIAAVSSGVGLLGVLLVASMPERPRVQHVDGGWREWWSMLRSGTSEASSSPRVRRWVLVYAVVMGCTALDEAFPLLAVEVGVATALVPVWMAVTVLGQLGGSALGGRRVSDSPLAVLLLAAGGLIAAGSLSGTAWGFVPIAAGYGVVQYAIVLADARLQESVEGPARATVTSVAGLGSGFAALGAYGVWGAVTEHQGNTVGVAAMAVLVLPAVWLVTSASLRSA
ncbi:MAG: MFS transporter [Thermocrispum sp.]